MNAGRCPVRRGRDLQIVEELAEELTVFREIDVARIGPDDRDAESLQRQRQIQRRLAAELDDHSIRLLHVADVQHVLESERLEVQAVAGVVIGRHGLGVAIDHDRFDPALLQGKRRMAAAVVELDALSDPIGTTAKDHHLAPRRRFGFVRELVAGIEVRREALKLRRAGVDAIEDCPDAERLAALAHGEFIRVPKVGELGVGDAGALGPLHLRLRSALERHSGEILLDRHHLPQLFEEPRVDRSHLVDLGHGIPALESEADISRAGPGWE